MKTIQHKLNLLILLLLSTIIFAQNEGVSIKNNPSAPHGSAMLDVESATKGMLIPRVALTSLSSSSPIAITPTTSLLVYNTTSNSAVTPGFYYWENNSWKKIGNELWSKISTGNSIEYFNGNVRVGNSSISTAPVYDFEVQSGTGNPYSCLFQSQGEQLRWGYNDYNGEAGAGPGNVLIQKTAKNSNCFLSMRYVQMYESGDWGFGVTSYGKCAGQRGGTYVESTLNDLHLSSGGNLSLETTSQMFAQIPGALFELQPGGWINVSDSTLKKEIVQEPDNTLDKIMRCRPVNYKLRADKSNTKIHGLIAQELETVFPELVHNIKIYDKDSDGRALSTFTTKKGVGYDGLITILLKGMQQQQEQIELLKTQVKALQQGK